MPVEMVDACHVKTLSDWFGWWDGTFEEHTSKDFYDQHWVKSLNKAHSNHTALSKILLCHARLIRNFCT